jgi:hypothetical protein
LRPYVPTITESFLTLCHASQLDLATILLRAGAPVETKDHACRGQGVTAEALYRARLCGLLRTGCFEGSPPVATLRMWQRMLCGESDSD